MENKVSFTIELTDNGSIKKISADTAELGNAVRRLQDEAQNAIHGILTWAEASQAVDVLQNAIIDLQNVMTDLTSAYQVQLVAETQINTIMRQRMKATDKGSKEEEHTLVQNMNQTYGQTMGYYSTVAQWYTALTTNSEAYCAQMINEIRLRNLANKAAELQAKRNKIQRRWLAEAI